MTGRNHCNKTDSFKDSFKTFKEKLLLYALHNYKNGVNIFSIIIYIKDVDHTKWAPPKKNIWTTTSLENKIYEIAYNIYLKRKDFLDVNKVKIY